MRHLIFLFLAICASCSSANYGIYSSTDPDKKLLQVVKSTAPGGDTFVVIVYTGADKPPNIRAGGDATALVQATAAAGRKAVKIALQAARAPVP